CGRAVSATRAGDDGDQGEDRAEQQADGRAGKGDRLHGQGGCLSDAVPPGGHLLPGGHRLARGELAEYAQHLGKLRVRPEQAGRDPVQLALMVVAKAHNMLLNCGIAAGADLAARCPSGAPGCGSWPPSGPAPSGRSAAGRSRVTGRVAWAGWRRVRTAAVMAPAAPGAQYPAIR